MGCDIHMYVEHKDKDGSSWWSFGGRINPGRIYGMFAKLAGVRNSFGITPLFQPRGIPDDMGSEAFSDYTLYVTNKDEPDDDEVSKDKAAEWVKDGYSKYYRDGKFVSSPDWHSESWCNADELEQAINEVWKDKKNGNETDYTVVLDMLRSFERQGQQARAVFWFDN